MTMQAFQGDAALKSQLIEPIRARWAARELLPASILKWMPDQKLYSLCGALVESQDADVFRERSGIPLELAMLCEALVQFGVEVSGDPEQPAGFSMAGSDDILSFGTQWLDAIAPGADLSDIVPQFAVHIMQTILSPDFAMAGQIEVNVRAAGDQILALWQRELAGETADSKQWRAIRRATMEAAEACTTPWCYPVAAFFEAMSWPVRGLGGEFVSSFQYFMQNWLNHVRGPFLEEQDRADQIHALVGGRCLEVAGREGDLDEAATMALLDTMPDAKRALMAIGDPVARARLRAGRNRAAVATDPLIRREMDLMLGLIAGAGPAA